MNNKTEEQSIQQGSTLSSKQRLMISTLERLRKIFSKEASEKEKRFCSSSCICDYEQSINCKKPCSFGA